MAHSALARRLSVVAGVGLLAIGVHTQAPTSVYVVAFRTYAGAAVYGTCDPKFAISIQRNVPWNRLLVATSRREARSE
jgi:hypothetical protein